MKDKKIKLITFNQVGEVVTTEKNIKEIFEIFNKPKTKDNKIKDNDTK